VIYTQHVTGDQTVGCRRGRTLAKRLRPFDNFIENHPIQDFNRSKEEYNSGKYEKGKHKQGELEPDSSKHF
jgi:hypothetical protein